VAVHWEVAPEIKEVGAHETETVVVAVPGEYSNFVVPIAVPLFPPHVAFTRYVPAIQHVGNLPVQNWPPPETVSWLKSPVAGLTGSSWMSTVALLGFEMTTMTAVFGPGAGDTVPLIVIWAVPTYEVRLVWTATL
jgi:hypothetical protein